MRSRAPETRVLDGDERIGDDVRDVDEVAVRDRAELQSFVFDDVMMTSSLTCCSSKPPG